jgi:hypothetical protein
MRAVGRRFEQPRRVGHQRAPQRHQLGIATREDALGFRRIGDAAERGDRHAGDGGAQLANERKVGHARRVTVRDMALERARMAALREADVVHSVLPGELGRDRGGLARPDAAGYAIVAGELQPDDESPSAHRADRRHQVGDETGAPFEVAAIAVGADVRVRRKELVEHVPVRRGDLNATESAALHARRRLRKFFHQALDLRDPERARHRPAQIVREHRSADRIGVAPGHVASPAALEDLRHQPAILGLHCFRPALQPIHRVVVPGAHAVRQVLVARHAEWLGHDERGAAASAVGVIANQAIAHAGVLGHLGRHGSVHEPVAQSLAGERERRH